MTLIEQELENAALACAKAARIMRNKDTKKEDVSCLFWHAAKLMEMAREYEKETA